MVVLATGVAREVEVAKHGGRMGVEKGEAMARKGGGRRGGY